MKKIPAIVNFFEENDLDFSNIKVLDNKVEILLGNYDEEIDFGLSYDFYQIAKGNKNIEFIFGYGDDSPNAMYVSLDFDFNSLSENEIDLLIDILS